MPRNVNVTRLSTSSAPAAPIGTAGRRRQKASAGVYGRRSQRSSGLSRSDGGRRKSRLASTGISVSVSTREPITASEIVTAMGRKSLPSIRWNVRIGT